jgi:uncharacterized membrane protein (DUF2068 family)
MKTPNRPLQAIALVEAGKGMLVLLAGFGVLALVHHDLQSVAEDLVRHFHLNPASRYPRIFIHAATNATGPRLWHLALFAFLYSVLRLAEAYGLWFERLWGEWLAVTSTGIYIPIELYELFIRVTWIKLILFLVNTLILLFLVRNLWKAKRT